MKNLHPKYSWLLYLFALVALLNLYANVQINYHLELGKKIELVTKPLLMPILLAFFFLNAKPYPNKFTRWVIGALILAWLGDVFLLFTSLNALYFALGLGSFLISQIFYSIAFVKSCEGSPLFSGENTKTLFSRLIPFIGSGVLMLVFLYPWLDEVMRIAVPLYVFVIIFMAFLAMERSGKVPKASAEIVFLGAFCFLVSDSVLAIDTFAYRSLQIPLANVIVMLTYIVAQFLIVWGMLIQISGNQKIYTNK